MNYIGRIRQGSAIDRQWLGAGRRSGVISGVAFHRFGNGQYETREAMTADQVAGLSNHPSVEMIVTGIAIPAASAADNTDENEPISADSTDPSARPSFRRRS